jgi:hypothetical protein
MSKFNEGDRVKVVNPDGWNNGKMGTVKSHHSNGMVTLVYDASPRDHVSAVWHEDLRLALSEDQEIEKIAEALKKEEIRGWTNEDYIETAKSLYRSGVRFDG